MDPITNSMDRVAGPSDQPCAVEGCENRGRPQVCPYDQRYHHHGRIHYDTAPGGHPARAGLEFRDGWNLICNRHFADLEYALVEHQKAIRA